MGRLTWRAGTVLESVAETPRVKTLTIDAPEWPGHRPGQHVDLRLTAEDGYQAVRSYSLAAPASNGTVMVTVERLDDGEVSPYLVDEARPGDQLELRGPVGGYFVWEPALGGPLLLVGGGSGVVPLAAMVRARAAAGERRAHSPAALRALSRRGDLHGRTRPPGRRGPAARVTPPTPARPRSTGRATAAASTARCSRRSRGRAPIARSRSCAAPRASSRRSRPTSNRWATQATASAPNVSDLPEEPHERRTDHRRQRRRRPPAGGLPVRDDHRKGHVRRLWRVRRDRRAAGVRGTRPER